MPPIQKRYALEAVAIYQRSLGNPNRFSPGQGAFVETTGKRICPSCAGVLPLDAILCKHCGRDLTVPSPTKIVPDGANFAIAIDGEIKLHGLELAKAKRIAAILDEVQKIS